MNARTVTCAILLGLGWACATVQGQDLPPGRGVQPPPIPSGPAPSADVPLASPPSGTIGLPSVLAPDWLSGTPPQSPSPPGTSGLSDYILYRRPGQPLCCDPGPLRPFYTEAYLRAGPAVPVGGTYLGRELLVGWSIEGGVRGLFFSQPNSAWVVDLGVVNTNNGALSPGTPVLLGIYQPNAATGTSTFNAVKVTVKDFNVTMASLGAGKEYYLTVPNEGGGRWRVGWDFGGRWGSSDMVFNEIRHRTRTCEGAYLAASTDYEIPCGSCFVGVGLRCEWSYTWDTILQKATDVQEITGLVTFSVRY